MTRWQGAVRGWIAAGTGIALDRVVWADQNTPLPTSAAGAWVSLRELGEASGGSDWLATSAVPLEVDLEVEAVNAAADSLTITSHGLATGDGPLRLTTTGALPGGLAVDTDYWAIRLDVDTLQLAATFLGAVETPTPVVIAGGGAGAHHLTSTAATRRAGAEIERTVMGTRTVTVSVQCYGGGASVDANGAAARLKRTLGALSLPSIKAALRAANVGLSDDQVGAVQNVSGIRQVAGFEPRAAMTVQISVPIVDTTEPGTVIETVEPQATLT